MTNWYCKSGILTLLVIVLLLPGCGGTRVKGIWKKSDFTGGPFKKILVVGITKDERNKCIWEDIMAEQLRKLGVNAETSEQCFPGDTDITKEEILDYVLAHGMDGVIVTRLVDVVREKAYYPPRGGQADIYYGRSHYGYYNSFGTYYDEVYRPGYTATFTTVLLETNLYDVATQQLVWSMSSGTLDPDSLDKLAESVSAKVVKAMQKDNMIGQSR